MRGGVLGDLEDEFAPEEGGYFIFFRGGGLFEVSPETVEGGSRRSFSRGRTAGEGAGFSFSRIRRGYGGARCSFSRERKGLDAFIPWDGGE